MRRTKALAFGGAGFLLILMAGCSGTPSPRVKISYSDIVPEAPAPAAETPPPAAIDPVVAEGGPMQVEISRDYKWSTDQVSIKVRRRLDGDLLDTGAVKYLVSADD